MPLDQELLNRKIKFISQDLNKLRKISFLEYDEFIKSKTEVDYEVLAERYLERIIGRMTDINYHILSAEKNYMPSSYFNSFIDMGKHGFISAELAGSLANSAGLRNRLAHEYDSIDEKKVYEAIGRCLKEVPEYLQSIIRIINKGSKQKRLVLETV